MKAPAAGRLLCSADEVPLSDLLYLLGLLVHITTTKVATELRLVMSLLLRLSGCLRLLLLLICVIH